jgi:hypothetical protein
MGTKYDLIYVAESLFNLDGNDYCNDVLESQITNEATVEGIGKGLVLLFENNRLIKAAEYSKERRGDDVYLCRRERQLKSNEIGLKLPNYKPHKIVRYDENTNGLHQLGGTFSEVFHQPENNCVAPFQYLGFINHKDSLFSWLPFTVHLACPIYLDFDEIFLDYSNPSNPTIINKSNIEKMGTAYNEELNQNSYIVFEPRKFNFVEDVEYTLDIQSGLPNWIQGMYIPKCPKTGRKMKFLCQIYHGTKTKETNIKARNKWFEHYFEKMNFWGDGDLYIFFEPTSHIACYFIQNT